MTIAWDGRISSTSNVQRNAYGSGDWMTKRASVPVVKPSASNSRSHDHQPGYWSVRSSTAQSRAAEIGNSQVRSNRNGAATGQRSRGSGALERGRTWLTGVLHRERS